MDEGPFRLPRAESRPVNRRSVNLVDDSTSAAVKPPERSALGSVERSIDSKRRLSGWVLGVMVGLLVGVGVTFTASRLLTRSTASLVDQATYQAVFSTNGQVYFGKLSQPEGDYLLLENVYYVQPKSSGDDTKQSNDLELIKLGSNEVYGPRDEMVFVRDQVLYYENLDPDGKVSNLIRDSQGDK